MSQNQTKGQIGGKCFRSACQSRPARWYNYSTRMYYCGDCARLINDQNHVDAMRTYGHDLCVRSLGPLI